MEGLKMLQVKAPMAVVLSDMRMPGMDGAAFLARVREVAPDTCRMLLTGHADVKAAIAAVNQGQIFRFLTKPCPPADLQLAFEAAVEQYRLITSERVLLEQTLSGSIRALVDVLSITNPVSFGRTMRVQQHVSNLAEKLGLRNRWHVEVAAMLSQLGCITLPPETIEKLHYGRPMLEAELRMVSRLDSVTERLLGNIPRLEVVRAILANYAKPFQGSTTARDHAERQLIQCGASILRIAIDYDVLDAQRKPPAVALDIMRGRFGRYDPEILEAFAAIQGGETTGQEVRDLPISAIRQGMVFAEDVKMSDGTLLAARGYVVTAGFVERALNFPAGIVREPVRVLLPSTGHGRG